MADFWCEVAKQRVINAILHLLTLGNNYFDCVEHSTLGKDDPACQAIAKQFQNINAQLPGLMSEEFTACQPPKVS